MSWTKSKNAFGRDQWVSGVWTIAEYDGHFLLMSLGGRTDTLDEAKDWVAEIESKIIGASGRAEGGEE